MSGKSIDLGSRQTGDALSLDPTTRSTHVHVIGGTGVGKSYLLEHMIRRDIRAGHGVCLIDPHGETYDNLVAWLARQQYRWPVHLLNPSENKWSLGFNPLASGDADPSVRVDAMTQGMLKGWKDVEEMTPRLSRFLRLVLYALAVRRLSIYEADYLTTTAFEAERLQLTADLPNTAYARQWAEANAGFSKKQFVEYFDSLNSRFLPYLASPALRPILAQSENVLDFGRVMDRGEIVLVNLGMKGDMTGRDARLLGAMLFSDLLYVARRRDVATAKKYPFYCYVDECADFLTDDIARILDQTRKYGLHLTLAHQRLQQLRDESEAVYSGVMESAKSKIVFKVDDDDSAEILSRHLFRKQFNLELPKQSMIRPTVVGQEKVILQSESTTETEAESYGAASGSGSGVSENSSEAVWVPDAFGGEASGYTETSGTGESSSDFSSSSASRSTGIATSSGWSEGFKNVFANLPTALHSLDELIHQGIVSIRSLPPRHAYVYLAGETAPIAMMTADVRARFVRPENIKRFVTEVHERNSWSSSAEEVSAEISGRAAQWQDSEFPVSDDDSDDEFRI